MKPQTVLNCFNYYLCGGKCVRQARQLDIDPLWTVNHESTQQSVIGVRRSLHKLLAQRIFIMAGEEPDSEC